MKDIEPTGSHSDSLVLQVIQDDVESDPGPDSYMQVVLNPPSLPLLGNEKVMDLAAAGIPVDIVGSSQTKNGCVLFDGDMPTNQITKSD